MVDSPKTNHPMEGTNKKWRPSTPHPPRGKAFDFVSDQSQSPHSPSPKPVGFVGDDCCRPHTPDKVFDGKVLDRKVFNFVPADTEHQGDNISPGGCMGISLATVMNTFRGPPSTNSVPTSPLSVHDEDGTMFYRFRRFRSAVQKTLTHTYASTRSCQLNAVSNSSYIDDRHVSFEFEDGDSFERDRSLMERAASWGTRESGALSPSSHKRSSESNQQVHFHYPPITSVRLRPRTESYEIKQLFFAPEELDEIEDDRSDTRAADDVETLAVGANDWGAVPTSTSSSSIVTASDYDDQESRSASMLGGEGTSNIMFNHSLEATSPKKKESSAGGTRYVRGVQILLREKSTG